MLSTRWHRVREPLLWAGLGLLAGASATGVAVVSINWRHAAPIIGDLAPAATALAGVAAFIIGMGTLLHRAKSEARSQWWERMQWATDHRLDTTSGEKHEVGSEVLYALIDSPLADEDELRVIDAVLAVALDRRSEDTDTDETSSADGGREDG
ncbi:hypothetical protein [Paraoerskovia marina]|uniref:hypothetical protein n=1 Tax=Paraoerskovia marina TaxID=545619 RepID=UPI0012DD5494|nr:hypothetical protein [Paraoerskovia marina]